MAFEGSTTMAVLMALANRTPPPLHEKNPEVPQKLSELVSALLAKDPAMRPASAHDLCEQLDEILATIPNAYQDVAVGSGIRRRPASGGISATPSTSVSGPKTANVPAANPPSSVTAYATPTSRRWWPLGLATFIGAAGILGLFLLVGNLTKPTTSPEPEIPVPVASEPIRIGVLHSLSGTMALSEAPVVDAVLMAIDEVNAAGGVLGQPLEAHVIDGASDPSKFASAAEELYGQKKVSTIFGCWTSASRKAVRPIAERHNALLVYPVQYEGLEQSPHIVYLGPAPNQQIPLALDYVVKQLGKKRIFLIGSDYIYPRAANAIIKDELKTGYSGQAEIAGEAYVPLGSKAVEEAIAQIEKVKPDVILNTVNGTTNFHLFRAMHQKSSVGEIPVLSFSMSESDLRTLDPKMIAGDYLCGIYFEDIGHPAAAAFLKRFRERYGDEKRYSDPILSAYCGVHLWAQAANASKSLQATAVTKAFREVSFDAPIGTVRIEPASLHAWLPGRIGRIKNDGNIEVVSQSDGFLRPEPFPASRSRAEWDLFLNDLFLDWDGHWQAPTR
jgi:urea transport system substrate-binding protein